MMSSKIEPLTSLRFFAAAGVVVYHLQSVVGTVPQSGFALGVSFFFVLSGFILTYTYGDKYRFNFRKFMIARFARLWPVHLATLLLVALLFGESDSWSKLLLNLFLLHSWLPVSPFVFTYNWVSWSISSEVAFYLLFPLIAFSRYLSAVLIVTAGTVVLILLSLHLSYSVADIYSAPPFGFSPIHMIMQNPMVRVFEFACGVVAARVFLAGRWREIVCRYAAAFEFTAVAASLLFIVTSEIVSERIIEAGYASFSIWYNQSGGFAVFAAMIFVFAHSAGPLSKALSARPLVFLGEISFCTYMVHQIVTRYASDNLLVYPGNVTPLRALALVSTIYAASFLLWLIIERPCRKWIVAAAALTSLRTKPT